MIKMSTVQTYVSYIFVCTLKIVSVKNEELPWIAQW